MSQQITLRDATIEDGDEVAALETKIGFVPTSPDYWAQLWSNPILSQQRGRISAGFVLEERGRIVGHYGNIPMLYALGERDVVTAAGMGLAVDPEYRKRGLGVRLSRASFEQPNVDVVLGTTTNAVAGGIFRRRCGARYVSQPGYGTALLWVLRPGPFLAASLGTKLRSAGLASVAGALLAPILSLESKLRGRKPVNSLGGGSVEAIEIDQIGGEFDELWSRKRIESERLMAFRTAELLRWHFQNPVNKSSTRVLCCRQSGRLAGYLILTRMRARVSGIVRSRVIDLFVERDDPAIIDRLLRSAYELAREDDSHMLEILGFPSVVRESFLRGRPYRRNLPCNPYLYKAFKEPFLSALDREESWYACSLDGDASLRGDA